MDRTLTSFIWAWITFILIVNLFGIVGLFMSADSYGQALQEVRQIYSPLNVINWLLELLILSPALALMCGESSVENPCKITDLRPATFNSFGGYPPTIASSAAASRSGLAGASPLHRTQPAQPGNHR